LQGNTKIIFVVISTEVPRMKVCKDHHRQN